MRVFKFGGASVKDAEAVKNVASIIHSHDGQLVVVFLLWVKLPMPWKRL